MITMITNKEELLKKKAELNVILQEYASLKGSAAAEWVKQLEMKIAEIDEQLYL
jgi:hypothetical protein